MGFFRDMRFLASITEQEIELVKHFRRSKNVKWRERNGQRQFEVWMPMSIWVPGKDLYEAEINAGQIMEKTFGQIDWVDQRFQDEIRQEVSDA